MGFDLRRFLRRTPADSLKSYFVSRCEAAADVDWSEPQARLVVRLIGLLEQLDPEQRAEIWAEFERIAQFDDESGRKALRSVISGKHILAAFDRLEGNNACGIHILLADPDSFERALAVHYATRLRNGRDWSGLEVLGGSSVSLTEGNQALDAFASRLSEAFHAEGGGRRRLKVESFARRDQDPAGGAPRALVQFTIYVEGPPEIEMAFESDAEVIRRTTYPVAEAAIVFDETERALDVVSKGGKDLRREIAEAFVATMTTSDAAISTRARRALRLEKLKTRPTFNLVPEDRVRRVEVESLRLAAPDAAGGLVTIDRKAAREGGGDDLHTCAARWFGRYGPPGGRGWRVLSAKLRVVFEPERKGRAEKRVIVELKAPDRSNLRDQTERHHLIAETLLARWGLYADVT